MDIKLFIPVVAWITLTIVCLVFILAGLRATLNKTSWDNKRKRRIFIVALLILVGWSVLLSLLSNGGFFSDFNSFPPRPALALMIPLPFIIWFALSSVGTELLRSIPSHWLIYMQSFRIAVELLLFVAFIRGLLPVQMTFDGRNFDVITGILSLPVGYIVAKRKSYSRQFAIAYNFIGVILLLNILVIAVLSMPTPIRYFTNEPANTIVAKFPYILLPGVLVPIAYGLHIFLFRQLWLKRGEMSQASRFMHLPTPGRGEHSLHPHE